MRKLRNRSTWVVRQSDGRYQLRPSFEADCEVTVGGRRLVAYSGQHKAIRLADPATREDTAVLTDSRSWIRTLYEVDVDCRPLLASGGRDGVVGSGIWRTEARGWPPSPVAAAGCTDCARCGARSGDLLARRAGTAIQVFEGIAAGQLGFERFATG